jgi:hypothetical protein
METIKSIQQNQMVQDMFMFVSIHNAKYKLPPFVDRVPLIYLKESQEVIVDEDISRFVTKLLNAGASKMKKADTASASADANVEYAPLLDMTKGFTDNFSFLSGPDETQSKNYVYLQDDNVPKNIEQFGEGKSTNSKSKFDEGSYDKFLSQRDLDIVKLFPKKGI